MWMRTGALLAGAAALATAGCSEPLVKLSPGYGPSDRLDPGQDATHSIDAELPVEALKAKRLKEVRFELIYIPSPIREESMRFAVSVTQPR